MSGSKIIIEGNWPDEDNWAKREYLRAHSEPDDFYKQYLNDWSKQMPENKLCPFNKDHKDLKVKLDRQRGYYVQCQTCFASGPYGLSEKDAWEVWNERK